MKNEIERRAFAANTFRVTTRTTDGQDQPPIFSGHAAVFDQLSEDLGGFHERIAPGTFAATLQNDDIRALFNHDPNFVLGRNKAGTLRMSEDQTGLHIEIDPPNTQIGRDLMTSVARGDISQMSFGFQTIQDKWDKRQDGWVRTLLEVRLLDISPVTYAAYPQTDVAVRALNHLMEEEKHSFDTILFRRRARLRLASST